MEAYQQPGEFLRERVAAYFAQFTFPQVTESTEIKLAELGNDAGVIGGSIISFAICSKSLDAKLLGNDTFKQHKSKKNDCYNREE